MTKNCSVQGLKINFWIQCFYRIQKSHSIWMRLKVEIKSPLSVLCQGCMHYAFGIILVDFVEARNPETSKISWDPWPVAQFRARLLFICLFFPNSLEFQWSLSNSHENESDMKLDTNGQIYWIQLATGWTVFLTY